MFCRYCGSANNDSDTYCKNCNRQLNAPQNLNNYNLDFKYAGTVSTGKNAVLACVLSLLIVGLGQFYNNDYKKGIIMLVLAVITGTFSSGILWFAVGVWSAYDAYCIAKGKGHKW